MKLCAVGRSCLGSTTSGINHNKFALFSSGGGATAHQVVFQTSSNMTPSNYARYWNSAITVARNTELYTA